MPKISVIIPVYNTEKYLRKCLDSVCNQTLSDIEIICINDCSTDNSLKILKEYESKDNRIKLINFEENKGVSIARNTGIDEAKGEYIGFVDSDDFVDLDFYEKLYNKAEESNSDCVKGNIYDYDNETQESNLTLFYDQNEKIKENKAYFCYGFTSAIYKTKLIKEKKVNFPESITYFEDPYFSIFASIYVNKVELVNDAKYNYVRHKDSVSRKILSKTNLKDFFKMINNIVSRLGNIDISKNNYCVYLSFLLEQLIPKCSDITISKLDSKTAIDLFCKIISNESSLLNLIFTEYFKNKRLLEEKNLKKYKSDMFKNLRKNLTNNGVA